MEAKENYIVTGAGGYVGFAIVKELINRGITPRCLVSSGKTKHKLEELGASVFFGDITKIDTLNEIFDVKGELFVIHSAGLISVEKRLSKQLYDVNVVGTENVIKKCEEKNASLVYISSIEAAVHNGRYIKEVEYNPLVMESGYAKTKAMASELVVEAAKKGLRACIMLPCAVFGPYDYRDGPATKYCRLYLKHSRLPFIRGGYQIVDCRDIACAAVEGLKRGKSGESYILSNTRYELYEVINVMLRERGKREIKFLLPTWFVKTVACIAEPFFYLFGKRPVFTAYTIKCINTKYEYSHERATMDLGYKPRIMEETALDMLAFIESQSLK